MREGMDDGKVELPLDLTFTGLSDKAPEYFKDYTEGYVQDAAGCC
eukprot:gene21870-8506_t